MIVYQHTANVARPPPPPYAAGLPLSAMATAKHYNISGSAMGRRGAADERRGRGRLAPTDPSSSTDTMIDPGQKVEYKTSWSDVGLSPCMSLHY